MNHAVRRSIGGALALAVAVGAVCFIASCGSGDVELIPRSVLVGNPEKMMARLSPGGERMAYIAPVDDVLNVWVRTIGENDDRVVTHDDNRGIFRYFWAHDNKHLMYLQDKGGDENWRLYAVDLGTGEERDLTPYENVQVRIADVSKHHPNTIIVTMNKQDERLHDVYRLELDSGELTLVARNPGNIIGWMTDADFEFAASHDFVRDNFFVIYSCPSCGNEGREARIDGPPCSLCFIPLRMLPS